MTQLYRTAKRVINCWNEFGSQFGFEEVMSDLEKVILMAGFAPTVVCLCGSTRFWRIFQKVNLQETLAGKIVLSIGAASSTDDEHFGNLPREEYERIKTMLDDLHLRKIDLASEILVLNVDDYVGESTAKEIIYAKQHGKKIRWLVHPSKHDV